MEKKPLGDGLNPRYGLCNRTSIMYSLPLEVTRRVILDERLISVSRTISQKWYTNHFFDLETLPRSYTAFLVDSNRKATCTDTINLKPCYQNVRPMPRKISITSPMSDVPFRNPSTGSRGHDLGNTVVSVDFNHAISLVVDSGRLDSHRPLSTQ